VKLASVAGITPVSMRSPADTERELAELIVKTRGGESAHDPGIALAAHDAAQLAHENAAGLVAVVDHPRSDPAVLVGMVVHADLPFGADAVEEVRTFLEASAGADIHEITESRTERGYPVLIAERIVMSDPPSGCQLQAVVVAPAGGRLAVFTLHSLTGRGWLELAAVLGELLSSVSFD
jgi:hypothetical protein